MTRTDPVPNSQKAAAALAAAGDENSTVVRPRAGSGPLFTPRRIAASSVWNLGGLAAPLAAAAVAFPVLTGALGSERFGVLLLTVIAEKLRLMRLAYCPSNDGE